MTENNDVDRFKIRLDDEEPLPDVPEDFESIRFQRINRRIALFAVAVPLVLGIVVGFLYFDMRSRLQALENAGQTDVQQLSQKLSREIDANMASAKNQTEAIKARLEADIANFQKEMTKISKQFKKETEALKSSDTAKVDKATLSKTIDDMSKKLTQTMQDVTDKKIAAFSKTVATDARNLSGKLKQEIASAAAAGKSADERLTRELAVLDQRVRVLVTDMERYREAAEKLVSRQYVDQTALDKVKTENAAELKQVAGALKDLKDQISTLQKKVAPLIKAAEAPKETTAAAGPSGPPSLPGSPSKPGGMVEQDITD